jgi:hypothetical protein
MVSCREGGGVGGGGDFLFSIENYSLDTTCHRVCRYSWRGELSESMILCQYIGLVRVNFINIKIKELL